MVKKTNKIIRQHNLKGVEDPANIQNLTFNEASGSVKSLTTGPFLKPLNNGAGGFTTNATSVRSVRKGSLLAIYNTSTTTARAITFGDTSAVAALAIGATDVDGNVGIACKPNDWTYLSNFTKQFLIANSADLVVYLMEDETYITNMGGAQT